MGDYIEIKANDGGTFRAYVEKPSTTPAPGVLCIQEIFGINHAMRDIAKLWADKGYVAVAPDLFWRQEPGVDITDQTEEEWQKAFQLFQGFDLDKGVDDLKAALAHMRAMPECTGKVGTVGFCLGGRLAYLMATRSDADCNVGYYGVGIESFLDEASNIKKPLVLHIAEEDKFVPKEAQAQIRDALKGHPQVAIHDYPGMDHAFARIGGQPYDKKAADTANQRTEDAFARALR